MSASTPTENGSALPLRPALRDADSDGLRSPKCGPAKVVSIAESEEEIPPLPSVDEASRPKIFTASTAGKRLTGRPTMLQSSSSKVSLRSQSSLDELSMSDASYTERKQQNAAHHHHPHVHHTHRHDRFVAQVTEWLQAERAKHAAKKSKRTGDQSGPSAAEILSSPRSRASSQGSDASGLSLERLQKIIEDNMTSFGPDQVPETPTASTPRRPSYAPGGRRRASSILKKLGAGTGSDTEYQDNEVIVPSCDVILDNSKTMSYSGGATESGDPPATPATPTSNKRAEKERKAWSAFKHEIVKLAHTLRLKGWRGVALDKSDDIEVERLSGALTNAVYVVSPPKNHVPPVTTTANQTKHQHRKPNKLLLRIYGPQVEHLIDRENELGILRRLARKKIGPRLLGTFENGRFEEFFNAQTLTPEDLVDPDTSKQIAKRMRELHDGVDLLEREREDGPFVWLNWDKWVGQCEQVITYLDKEIKSGNPGNGEGWRRRGLICGVEWPLFKSTVDSYRKWLDGMYGKGGVQRELVFAHNDTQYGNILRLIPEEPKEGSAPSPLLLPQNTHRQLIVIDFEYSSANTPGLEFANHFTEWCYNYHDEKKPWACSIDKYPTLEQQQRFIRSYVNHRPQFNARASATPKMAAADASVPKGSISDFYLDRTPGGGTGSATTTTTASYAEEERLRVEEAENLVEKLIKEARMWRVANSAQWVAWGIVQAKVPELENQKAVTEAAKAVAEAAKAAAEKGHVKGGGEKGNTEEGEDEGEKEKDEAAVVKEEAHHEEEHHDDEEEFDYLAYAQDRAMFFWGDVVGLGLIKREELPEKLRDRLKLLDY